MLYTHTYLTDGFFDMAKVLIRSYQELGGIWKEVPMVLDTRNLTEAQITELLEFDCVYKVYNYNFDMSQLGKSIGLSTRQLLECKEQIENGYVTQKAKVWKLITAGDDRVKAVYRMLFRRAELGLTGLIHFDADTLIRDDLTELAKLCMANDACLKLRPKINPVKARITIDLMTFRPSCHTEAFIKKWIKEIDDVMPLLRPVGFGQSTCWYAFVAHEQYMQVANLPLHYGLPGRNKPSDKIWCGNIHRLRKDDCTAKFSDELNALIDQQEEKHAEQ